MKYFLLCLMSFALGCTHQKTSPQKSQLKHFQGLVFGSTYEIKYHKENDIKQMQAQVEAFFKDFNQEFSTYRPDSVISHFNQLAPHQRLKVSARFIEMLKLALKLHQETQGAFDPSIGKSIKLWGFGGAQFKQDPSGSALKIAQQQSGMMALKWDEKKSEVWKTHPLILDLNAFAPGWAADLVGKLLKQNGIDHFMINIGGEILFQGLRPEGKPWTGGIEIPSTTGEGEIFIAFNITDLALATSGNYRQFRKKAEKIQSHIIDPASHRPVENHISSASVIADSAARADAWSTAMMVKGEAGLDLAEKMGIKAYLIQSLPERGETILMNPSMQMYLKDHVLNR